MAINSGWFYWKSAVCDSYGTDSSPCKGPGCPCKEGKKLLHHAGTVMSVPMWVRLTGQQHSCEAAFVVSPL